MPKISFIWKELTHHLPFSILSVAFGLITAGILTFITRVAGIHDPSHYFKELFHLFHPFHILFSALATTAMFWQNEKNFLKSVLIGAAGALGVCGISDIFIPHISGIILGADMDLHICVVRHPHMITPFLLVGLAGGFLAPGNFEKEEGVVFSHSLHVFVSALASVMYIVSFGMSNWTQQIGGVLIFMVLAVIVPCCISDIVFPLVCMKKEKPEAKSGHLDYH